jgi:hypothetical protein
VLQKKKKKKERKKEREMGDVEGHVDKALTCICHQPLQAG